MHLNVFLLFCFRQNTAYELRIIDCSSDVCSSDLALLVVLEPRAGRRIRLLDDAAPVLVAPAGAPDAHVAAHAASAPARRRSSTSPAKAAARQIGNASCRERVGTYV